MSLVCMQIPRFAFEKFPGAKAELTTQMKSVGEAMAMGRTFQRVFPEGIAQLRDRPGRLQLASQLETHDTPAA